MYEVICNQVDIMGELIWFSWTSSRVVEPGHAFIDSCASPSDNQYNCNGYSMAAFSAHLFGLFIILLYWINPIKFIIQTDAPCTYDKLLPSKT